jgi:predicted RNase H-like HicB family nuclease
LKNKEGCKKKDSARRSKKMYKYEIIVYWSEEEAAFIAEVPELSGCMADGGTYEEAVKNAQVVISEWIETAKKLKRETETEGQAGVCLTRSHADSATYGMKELRVMINLLQRWSCLLAWPATPFI